MGGIVRPPYPGPTMHPSISGPTLADPPVATLGAALERLACRAGPWLTVHRGSASTAYTAGEVLMLARRWARALQEAGVRPGDRAALLLPNDVAFVAAFFGCQYAGATPVPLAWPVSALDLGRTVAMLQPLVDHARPSVIVTTPGVVSLAPFGRPALAEPHALPAGSQPAWSPEDTAFIQYTSGSLGRPRGALISQRAAVASAWSMAQALGVGPDDVGVSWLPLFHDMGLVGGLLCPLLAGFPVHLLAPGEFLLHPRRWLACISEHRGTVAAAPDFAYALTARRVANVDGLDLSTWRHALNGSEPVHRATIEAFVERFGPVGFSAEAPRPVYGLAENTLGVSFSAPGEPDLSAGDRTLVSAGRPLPGMDVAIADSGEVLVRGPTLMAGYFEDPEATGRALRDGWLHTGDLGCIADGRLYVTGREKDLVIQNGRKFHPYDIERIAAAAVRAPPNGAAAFAARDEELVVVVEAPGDGPVDVERLVRGELLASLGVRPHRVVSVTPGDLPRTTSGKLRRAACVERYS